MVQHTVAIVGSGPAGYSAALYTSRANLKTLIFAGDEPGGQLMKTTEVENYPGFSIGIVGPNLMGQMQQQAVRFGAELVWETVTKIRNKKSETRNKFEMETNAGKTYTADAVILAMGAKSKLLGVGEEAYFGKGFSTCAVCDAPFYKDKNVYVVGGGDAAIEDAWALTKFAKTVTMLVRGESFRASKIMQKRITDNPDKIKVLWKSSLKGVRGERVEQLVLDVDGAEKVVSTEGLFLAIGHLPATEFLVDSGVALDERGYIKNLMTYPPEKVTTESYWLTHHPTMTSVEGIFAAGDCVDFRYRQAATAAGMGVSAALDAEKWLENGS